MALRTQNTPHTCELACKSAHERETLAEVELERAVRAENSFSPPSPVDVTYAAVACLQAK